MLQRSIQTTEKYEPFFGKKNNLLQFLGTESYESRCLLSKTLHRVIQNRILKSMDVSMMLLSNTARKAQSIPAAINNQHYIVMVWKRLSRNSLLTQIN